MNNTTSSNAGSLRRFVRHTTTTNMKLKIAASKLNDSGCTAILENDDDEQMHIATISHDGNPTTLCLEAARKLRECADRFEALASHAAPYRETTHREINRLQVDNSVAKCA